MADGGNLSDQSEVCNPYPLACAPWRFRVLAEWQGVRVRVETFQHKRDAKDLRNRLRERYGKFGVTFFIGFDPPRPRWAQLKAHLNKIARGEEP